jgi:phenylalanyl-tRNA synthetase beta chain
LPTVTFDIDDLMKLAGISITREALIEILSSLKCEAELEIGAKMTVEVTSDRPDFFSCEGLARGVRLYAKGGKGYFPKHSGSAPIQLHVRPSVSEIRPFIVAAAIHDVQLSNEAMVQIMQLQEKLHNTYGSKRFKASIGVYNLDNVQPDMIYEALPPEDFSFVPLEESRRMNGSGILRDTAKGREYSPILKGFSKYPLLKDSRGTVLSMPPIINSEETRVSETTRNLFIDVTGTDEKAINLCLNVMVTSILERSGKVQKVEVNYKNKKVVTPILGKTKQLLNLATVKAVSGLSLKPDQIIKLLNHMGFESRPASGKQLEVTIPPYRVDIIHEVDLVEDIIMAFGLNNMHSEFPAVASIGKPLFGSKFRSRVRDLMVGMSFQEISTYLLSNKALEDKALCGVTGAVEIEKPISSEYSAVRTSLLPKLLLFLGNNAHVPYPQRIFEYGDVVKVINGVAVTSTQLAAAISNYKVSFEDIQAVALSLFKNLSKEIEFRPIAREPFIDGRAAAVFIDDKKIGSLGEISPKILIDFGIDTPVGMMELHLSSLLSLESLFRG